jgi:hypothetical protein
MKTILLSLLLAITSLSCLAQINKGTVLLGGNLSFSRNVSKNTSPMNKYSGEVNTFSLNPTLGFFVSDKWMAGLNIGYSNVNSSNNNPLGSFPSESETNLNLLSVGPVVRYYQPVSDKISFFGQANMGFGFGKSTYESRYNGNSDTQEYNVSSFVIGLNPGVVFFLTRRIGLEASIGSLSFNRSSSKSESDDAEQENNSVGISFNPTQLGLGINYYFGN